MSDTVRTPIIDKNGKATHVNKKVDAPAAPNSRAASVTAPPTAAGSFLTGDPISQLDNTRSGALQLDKSDSLEVTGGLCDDVVLYYNSGDPFIAVRFADADIIGAYMRDSDIEDSSENRENLVARFQENADEINEVMMSFGVDISETTIGKLAISYDFPLDEEFGFNNWDEVRAQIKEEGTTKYLRDYLDGGEEADRTISEHIASVIG